jgi:hypothetical protein
MTFDIKHFAIQESNAWFRSGWSTLVDFYREYQCAVREHGTLFGEEFLAQHARYGAALEVLIRQTADSLAVPPGDVHPAIKGYLYEWCGWPDSPRDLDVWLGQRERS